MSLTCRIIDNLLNISNLFAYLTKWIYALKMKQNTDACQLVASSAT